ncbi:pleckstrin domain-containing 1-like [Brachionus plicatilis]|uniref:Pleckstrin domain-containing 1-like n=1 Tax=Brachionus plicatilis TaxID=10195 RepID=A0A3M7R7E8_BRAPC|nr:pleckstrin domain-containing 1-like [Brachionus plicatilis]
MLDDSEIPFQIESKTTGNELINLVYQYLKLVESDYFGLEFIDSKGKKNWLDYDKPVAKQIQNNLKLIFCVKFYTPDPGQLEEEYTRYLYALQIKRDLAEGLLLCTDATASLLASYILQAEIGDFNENFNPLTCFQNKNFFPHQNPEHESKIIDYYKNHIGQTPADADMNLLDIARKIELYGILMHAARDHEGVQLNLAVAHMGILVFQNCTKINTFSWAKIRKLSFKRKKFLVKLHPENYGFYKDTVEFYFDNRDGSKNFWKKCIEHHAFFRCISAQRMPRQKSRLLTRGSSFRYYGRTQKELIENARENLAKNRSFDRSYHSMRNISHYNYSGSSGAINFHPQGTQSLNRNLASRSTGAILQPGYATTGHGSTNFISSTDSVNLYQHQDHNERTIHSRHSLGKEKTLALSDHDHSDDQNTDEDCDQHGNGPKNATSTFKPPSVSLPIQQEKKDHMDRSNPNKIYSRKEVIQTTYKEEFLHTTTTTNLYSADKLSPSSSSPSSSSSNPNQEAHEDDDEDVKKLCVTPVVLPSSQVKKADNVRNKLNSDDYLSFSLSSSISTSSISYINELLDASDSSMDTSSISSTLSVIDLKTGAQFQTNGIANTRPTVKTLPHTIKYAEVGKLPPKSSFSYRNDTINVGDNLERKLARQKNSLVSPVSSSSSCGQDESCSETYEDVIDKCLDDESLSKIMALDGSEANTPVDDGCSFGQSIAKSSDLLIDSPPIEHSPKHVSSNTDSSSFE